MLSCCTKILAGFDAMLATVSSGAAHKSPMSWSLVMGCVISRSDSRFAAEVKLRLAGKPCDIDMPAKLPASLEYRTFRWKVLTSYCRKAPSRCHSPE